MIFSHRVLASAVLGFGFVCGGYSMALASDSTSPITTATIQTPKSNDAPAKVWLSLSFSTSDERAPDWKWLRSQIGEGRVLDALDAKRIGALVIPVFDDGRALFETQVALFKNRNTQAKTDEAALQGLLLKAQAANVPIYLGVDALGWQKVDTQAQWTTAKNGGIFDSAPELQEIKQDFGINPPRGTLYASPFNPKVGNAVAALMTEIARKFPTVAGVVLDVRLSREEITGYSGAARVAAMKTLRFDPVSLGLQGKADDVIGAREKQWMIWRAQKMSDFVKRLSTAFKTQNSQGRVLVSGEASYSAQADFNALRTAQDWKTWTTAGIVDGALLEGHWLPRYQDRELLTPQTSNLQIPQSQIVAASLGGQLSSESSYSRDWKSLRSVNSDLDSIAAVVRNDDDLRAVSALLRGEDILPIAPTPKVGEIAPEWALTDNVGKRWNGRDLRGQRAVAFLITGAKGIVSPETLKALGESSETLRSIGIEPFIVSSSTLQSVSGLTNLVDSATEFLPSFHQTTSLMLIDRAGFVRDLRVLDVVNISKTFAGISEPTPKLIEGQIAPDFTIGDMNGQVRRLSDLQGKKNLLLTFFPKCFTGGCTNHLTSIQAEKAAFDVNDTEVLAVSIDTGDVQIAFAQRWSFTFPLVPDVGRNLSMLYDAARSVDDLADRQSVLIDKNGIVRLIDRNVDIHTHGADVLKNMQSLGLAK